MSSTLDSIIRRHKKTGTKSVSSQKSNSSTQAVKKETTSWSGSAWIIAVVVLVLLVLAGLAYWYFWSAPSAKESSSILDEMKSISANDNCRRTVETPGVVSMETFREYNSKFSRNFTKTDPDDF